LSVCHEKGSRRDMLTALRPELQGHTIRNQELLLNSSARPINEVEGAALEEDRLGFVRNLSSSCYVIY
jgi:hypothetical protein